MLKKTVPPSPGSCPYCGGALEPGFLKATQSAGLFFTSDSPDTITLDSSYVFRRTQTAPAAVCRACRKIILDYSPE